METVVKVRNLRKSFNDREVLNDISFDINAGEMVAVIGKSGRGKSTLLNIIGLIMEKESGEVWHFGKKDIKSQSHAGMLMRRNKIGYLFQNYGLVEEETVFWNLNLALEYKKMSKKEKRSKIEEVLKYVGLEKMVRYPVYKLSGGEQQRIAMARIILQGSDLILADEPTGSLDAENRDLIVSLLWKLKEQGKTIMIVTHDSYVAARCERTIEL